MSASFSCAITAPREWISNSTPPHRIRLTEELAMSESTNAVSSEGLLNGISVVEYGAGVAAAFATKLMADLGADVIKVETPNGDSTRHYGPFPGDQPDPEKSGLFAYLNANKRGITLDLTTDEHRSTLRSLLSGADLFVHNVHPSRRDEFGLASA